MTLLCGEKGISDEGSCWFFLRFYERMMRVYVCLSMYVCVQANGETNADRISLEVGQPIKGLYYYIGRAFYTELIVRSQQTGVRYTFTHLPCYILWFKGRKTIVFFFIDFLLQYNNMQVIDWLLIDKWYMMESLLLRSNSIANVTFVLFLINSLIHVTVCLHTVDAFIYHVLNHVLPTFVAHPPHFIHHLLKFFFIYTDMYFLCFI